MTTPNDPLRLRVRIDAQPDAVYKELTDADQLAEWFAESAEVNLDDNTYQFWGRYTPLGDRPRQTLTSAETNRSLRFSWDLDAPTTVEITIEDNDGGSVVTVTHAGAPAAQALALGCFWPVTLANLAAQCEGVQTMPPFDFSAPAQEVALARTVIDVPADEVYAFLLDPVQVGAWINGKPTIEAHVGGAYDFGWAAGPDNGPVQLLELEADKLIAYSWRAGGADTVVRWQLRGVRGTTFLTLAHDGFTDDAVAEEYRLGWPPRLVELKRRLELGDTFEPLTA